jgi:hypothetical protein
MEAAMTRRRTDPRPSLEASFEPQRSDQDALMDAYQRLPPPPRLFCLTPRTPLREEASDAEPRIRDCPEIGGMWTGAI